jgi:hypothetical protein
MAAGETDLALLLQAMQPELETGEFVFCSVKELTSLTRSPEPWGQFREKEGITLILPKPEADRLGLHYEVTFALITLTVHSSLTAIGFLAAITQCLAQAGINVNAISAYYHDHLFVPFDKAELGLQLLAKFSQKP